MAPIAGWMAGSARIGRGLLRGRGSRWRRNRLLPLVPLALFAALLLAIYPPGCTHTPQPSQQGIDAQGRTVRVRLLQNVGEVKLTATQPPRYFSSSDATVRLLGLPAATPMTLHLTPDGWRCGGADLGGGELVLQPAGVGMLLVDGAAYRGHYRLVPAGPDRFDVVNHVDLDEYLYSVISRELYRNWHEEAYRAQAIAARTYALFEKNVRRGTRYWDVWPDERSQVYGGLAAETARSREAVDATRGIVLAYGPEGEARIFKTYYSSCCGGVTQNVEDVFGGPPIPPLSAQFVGPVCSASRTFNWGPVVISKAELARRFEAFGARRNSPEQHIRAVRSITISQRNAHGRPTRFEVVDGNGQKYSWPAEQLRWAVNTDAAPGTTLYSSFVENIINESDRVRFVGGHGHGHGVGMCQWCLQARALAGIKHEDMLLYAYPGAKLLPAY
jgi:stage II sporulation protein D